MCVHVTGENAVSIGNEAHERCEVVGVGEEGLGRMRRCPKAVWKNQLRES